MYSNRTAGFLVLTSSISKIELKAAVVRSGSLGLKKIWPRLVSAIAFSGSYDVIGYIGYSFTKSPKALTFKEKQIEPFVGRFWPINPKYTWVTVIVEDWWSAAKVAQAGVRALCLNGVHLSWETAVGLGVERRDVVLALDSGTLPLMLKYKRMYGGLWQSCTIWELDKDLKYEQEETIINALRTGKTSFVSRDSESGVI
jgi:hypothetical protein